MKLRANGLLAAATTLMVLLIGCSDDGDTIVSTTAQPPATVSPTSLPTTSSSASTTIAPACSAAGMPAELPDQPGLPQDVALMRALIVEAAVACDFDGLARLMSPNGFQSYFDGDPQPGNQAEVVESWRSEEARGVPVLTILVETLDLPVVLDDEGGEEPLTYLWPSAFGYSSWLDIPEQDRALYLARFGDSFREDFELFGGFTGWRTIISSFGEWTFFAAGD